MSVPLAENLSFSNELKEKTQQNATPNHVTMISRREKAMGDISNISKHPWINDFNI